MSGPDAPPRRTERVAVGGEEMSVILQGRTHDLLLVHGFPSNALAWRLVMDRLGDRYGMVTPDQVGFGRSTRYPRRPLHGDAYADRLAGLLDLLGVGSIDVAALSWGAAVAQRFAIRHPTRVRRLVLLAPVSASRPLRLSDRALLGVALGRVAPALAREAVRRYLRRASGDSMDAETLDAVVEAYVAPLRMRGTVGFLRRFVRASQASVPADVRRIGAPTLVVTAAADRIVPPAIGLELSADIPGARLEVIQAGHALQFEAPDRVAALIDAFLSRDTVPT